MEITKKYKVKGQIAASQAVASIIVLFIGFGVATLMNTFLNVMAGQTYNLVEADIDNITDATIKASIKTSIQKSFEGNETVSKYMPLVALAVVIGIILTIILGFTGFAGMGGGGMRGGAL